MLRLVEHFLIFWAETARRAGWLLVLAFFLAALGAGWFAATHLRVNTDTSEMLDPHLAFQKNARALREAFPQIKTDIVIIVQGQTLDEVDAFAAALRERLLKRSDPIAAVFAPAQEPFFAENGLLYLDEADLESRLTQMTKASSLIEKLVKTPTADTLFATLAENDELAEKSDLGKETLQDIYAELAVVVEASLRGEKRPFSWMGALDADKPGDEGFIRLVYATPKQDFTRLQPAKPAIEAIRDEITYINEGFGDRVETYVTGDPALRAEELESVTTGIGLSFLISFVLVALLLMICYRSGWLAVITLTSLVITIVFTSAFAAAFVGELNLVSVAFTVLLVGLGLDFAIHLILHYKERLGFGQTKKIALRGAMHEVGPALVLAAITTALAFFSFIPTAFDGIAQLGIIAGVGVIIALFVSVTFTPAALALAPARAARSDPEATQKRRGLAETLSAPVAVVVVLLGLASVVYLPKARFDADPMSLRDPSSQSVRGFNLLFTDDDTLPYRLSRLTGSAEEAEATAAEAKKLETVKAARSLPDFVPDDQDTKLELIDFAAGTLVFALDAEREASTLTSGEGAGALEARLEAAYKDGPAAQLAALLGEAKGDAEALARVEENVFRFWPALIDRLKLQFNADYVDLDSLPEALSGRYRSADGQWRVDILPEEDVRDPAALSRFVSSVEAVYPDVSGGAIQTQKAGQVISESMLEATGIALVIIFVVLFALVRKPGLVFLMMAPLALAASLTTAAGVLLGIPFNYANVIVLPLLLGIGVDSGIHLVMRNQQVKAGEGVYGTSTPRAVLFSALTTVGSFGSLMLSPHRGTASMGELLSIAIAFTLLCTLFVLPAAFRLGEKRMPKSHA
ncbi:MAG: efflux RND transporter permease subunit [Pseudomonadota bacterium]|nr:efflux RND transporter permease subunit [Pseudomonadota bacterium]